ncbi:MAG: cyclic nucleotide-binding domain-containing protein [Planctomycetes bacterium]|nr:cyclic nucleotide-binding domain-containing protein [Planctomycetota bacterium]
MSEIKLTKPLLEVKKVLPILNKISILAGLNDDQLYNIFRMLEKVTFTDGEVVFKQGDQPSYIYIIKKGQIKLFVDNDEKPFELVSFGEGDCFGESSIIGIRPHAATAISQGDTELVVLSRSTLMSLYESDIHLFSTLILNIAREACRRLNASSETILHYVNSHQTS